MRKKIAIGMGILILLLIAGGLWISKKGKGKLQNQEQQQISQNIQQQSNEISGQNNNQQAADINDWKTYRNEEYGFEVKYPENWFVRVDDSYYDSNGRVGVFFSNYEKAINKGNTPSNFLMIFVMIYDKKNIEGMKEVGSISKSREQIADATEIISLENDHSATLFITSKKGKEGDVTWDLSLPIAGTSISGEKYVYDFSHSSEIGEEKQRKEILILRDMIKSFKILDE